MGRFRRRTHANKQKTSVQQGINGFFTPHEAKQVEDYLIAYREGARFETPTIEEKDISSLLHFEPHYKDNNAEVELIGSHTFPRLNQITPTRPYILLPPSLTKHQRKYIHALCENLFLFHGSITHVNMNSAANSNEEDTEERFFVISAHPSGFEILYKKNLLNPPVKLPLSVRNIKPWFYQKNQQDDMSSSFTWIQDSHVTQTTSQMRTAIDQFVNYPSKCIRENIDVFHLKELMHKDLSSVEPVDESYPLLLVDSVEKLKQCAEEITLSQPTELAFDMEMYNPSKHFSMTCLLQLAIPGKDYVIDVLAPGVWKSLKLYMEPFFSDPTIVKIGHAIGGMDVPSLHRDFGLFVVNAFDTFEAATLLGIKKAGLASLCTHYNLCKSEEYVNLKSVYQRSDWRKRPLTLSMIRYGTYDVHYLIHLRQLIIRDLALKYLRTTNLSDSGALPPSSDMNCSTEKEVDEGSELFSIVINSDNINQIHTVMKSLSISQKQCLRFWTHKNEKYLNNERIVFASKRGLWKQEQTLLYENLVQWRLKISIIEEIMPHSVCNIDFLLGVAINRPRDEDELKRIQYFVPELLEDPTSPYLKDLLETVQSSFTIPDEHEKSDASHTNLASSEESLPTDESSKVTSSMDKTEEYNDSISKESETFSNFISSKTVIAGIVVSFLFVIGMSLQRKK